MSSPENEARFLYHNEVNLHDRETKWLPTLICSACICTGSPIQTQIDQMEFTIRVKTASHTSLLAMLRLSAIMKSTK